MAEISHATLDEDEFVALLAGIMDEARYQALYHVLETLRQSADASESRRAARGVSRGPIRFSVSVY